MRYYDLNGEALEGAVITKNVGAKGKIEVPCLEWLDKDGNVMHTQLINLKTEEEYKKLLHDQWAETFDRAQEIILKASDRWLAYEAFCQQIGQQP